MKYTRVKDDAGVEHLMAVPENKLDEMVSAGLNVGGIGRPAILKQERINGVVITLMRLDKNYLVTWQGSGGKRDYNHKDCETIEEAESFFKEWCKLARVNKGHIKPR